VTFTVLAAPVPAINLGLNNSTGNRFSYGVVAVNTLSSHTFTLSNTGTAALTISTVGVLKTGTGGGAYLVLPGALTTCTIGATVPAGGSCTVDVEFTPMLSTNTTTATLTVTGVASGTTTPIYTAVQYLTGS
jgi:hypothetical protein